MSRRRTAQASTAELVDGSLISLRRLILRDADKVLQLYESLTDEERYFRFFTMRPAHVQEWARSIASGGTDQYSIGAFSSGKLLGVANYFVCQEPECAEVAVVVAHAEHLRGVGTALLHRLGAIARDRGLHHFVADVVVENHLMLQVLVDSGWPCKRHLDGAILHVEIDLDAAS
jgi:RimJ/RimL family protein N-acetyltransferase